MEGYESLDSAIKQAGKVLDSLPDHKPEEIEQAAGRLEGLEYVPTLLMSVPGFIRFSRDDLRKELDRVRNIDAETARADGLDLDPDTDLEALKTQQISLLIHHFELLSRLRSDEPEAWDEISELYEDD